MKNLYKTLTKYLAIGVTVLIAVVLFGFIFVTMGWAEPGPEFFIELGGIAILVIIIRITWYNWAEEQKLKDEELKKSIDTYDAYADKEITDTYDFEKFLVLLNKENRDNYVLNKLKGRTAKNCPKYDKLKAKYERMAVVFVKEIKSCDVKTRGETKNLYDSKNYRKQKKVVYQVASTIISIGITTLIAFTAFKQITMSWENVFRYCTYLCSMGITMWLSITTGYRNTENETLDHLSRLQFIVDKYVNYKEGKK